MPAVNVVDPSQCGDDNEHVAAPRRFRLVWPLNIIFLSLLFPIRERIRVASNILESLKKHEKKHLYFILYLEYIIGLRK